MRCSSRLSSSTAALISSSSSSSYYYTSSNNNNNNNSISSTTNTKYQWTPQQNCYRQLMKSLRAANFHDRAKLFWSRHRVLVEFYKYSTETNEESIQQLIGVGLEVAEFISHHMRMDVERIMKHNEAMLALPVEKAKKFRSDYIIAEKQHESWCKQKIKNILKRRPPPPYPFF